MSLSSQILSDITVHLKYSRYLKDKKRRETWEEICERNMDMHLKKYPSLAQEIKDLYREFVLPKKVLPSMRSLQFGGKPIEIANNRLYNCCFLPIDDYRCFSETMFLLLGGSGVGYSVQKAHIEKLPAIRKPTRTRRYVIGDSIEGWADSIKALMKAYMCGKSLPVFDFNDIREKGAPLITSGGKAPGPQPLHDCLHNVRKVLDQVEDGDQLTSLQVHDIICYIADAVLAGGIRRAALICLFDMDDEDMLSCKYGSWWELNPQRARANNSAVILRHKVSKDDFSLLWEKIKASGSGEPGIYLTNNSDWGTNPCCEIALRPFQFCNLTEINMHNVESQEDLDARARAAAFLGTLQAGYTDFHYLRDIWRRTTERDALVGVSGTGIASGAVLQLDLERASAAVVEENKRVAKLIGIRSAARTTCVKPAGTTSCVLGSSSGIHGWHDPFFVRRMRLGKNEAIYGYLSQNHPELVEDEFFKPKTQAVVSVPMKAPENAIFRHEGALNLLERIKHFSDMWIKPGHVKGDNSHNVSATVYIKEDEWDEVREWMWANRDSYNGISILPYDGGSYKQMPFETCDEETYNEMLSNLSSINLANVIEDTDNTQLQDQAACAGGVCEIN
jgi:ribonucleoside-triphosphate reductase (thioredoxin)